MTQFIPPSPVPKAAWRKPFNASSRNADSAPTNKTAGGNFPAHTWAIAPGAGAAEAFAGAFLVRFFAMIPMK